MKVINLGDFNSVLHTFVSELRDISIQNDRMRFRKNMERIGEIIAYEISKTLVFEKKKIRTPLSETNISSLKEKLVLGAILRASLPFHQGFLNFFDHAGNAFISAFRDYSSKEEFSIRVQYISTPDLSGKTLILADPMLATAASMELVYRELIKFGKPEKVHFASIISTTEGINYLQGKLKDENITLWTAAIDPLLDEHKYIVPGLGDAGDLAFGEKC